MRYSTHLAAAIAAILGTAAVPALAQDSGSSGSDQSQTESMDGGATDSEGSATGEMGTETDGAADSKAGDMMQTQEDSKIAEVGGTEIMRSDVMRAIQSLPPQMQQMPPQRLVPMAIDQLVMRELILQAAQDEGLAEDPEVTQMIEDNAQAGEEDAMVQVWLKRELEGSITDDAVQTAYDEIKESSEQEVPPLEDVRPQIEQQLRRDAFSGIREELQEGVEVTYYGPDGEPMEAGTAGAGAAAQGDTGAEGDAGSDSGMSTGDSDSGASDMETDSGDMSTGTDMEEGSGMSGETDMEADTDVEAETDMDIESDDMSDSDSGEMESESEDQ